jgi:hypothetical protein
VRPALVGHHAVLEQLLASRATLMFIRADAGCGGTRLLSEIESALSPARSLYLCSAGAEPLGALRRAFARSIATSGSAAGSLPPAHARGLERLLEGDGLDVRLGAELILQWAAGGAVLVDDAMEVDDPSLDVVAGAAEIDPGGLRIVARLDAHAALPSAFQSLPVGPTVNLGPLPRSAAEQLAASAAEDCLSLDEARRWARRGRFVPLAIVEALAEGLASGELSGMDDGVPTPRTGVDVRLQLDAKDWVARRLRFVRPPAKTLLRAVAVLGVEVASRLARELGRTWDTEAESHADALARDGWLVGGIEGFYVLPSRTHREVILADIPEPDRARWHDAASRVVEHWGGQLASAEAARHAAIAGDHQRAVELALVAAKASRQLELDAATDALLAFAGATPDDIVPLPAPAGDFRLMSWIDGLRPVGDRNGVAARLHAIASLAKGATPEALAALREGVEAAENAPPAARSRALLAYGIALAVAGRHAEAMFAALDALARAREGGEPQGARACARFLARLAGAAGHGEAAREWQRVAAEGI